MNYKVTQKYVPAAGSVRAPGEHYTVTNESSRDSWFREVSFYRSPHGSEVAVDGTGHPLATDGDIFRAVREAVEQYDAGCDPNEQRKDRQS